MASRKANESTVDSLDPVLPQKKRARRRLVGAIALALLAAVVLPLILDSEPRQVRDDVQVRIPSRETPLAERADGGDKTATPDSALKSEPASPSALPSPSPVSPPGGPAVAVPPADGSVAEPVAKSPPSAAMTQAPLTPEASSPPKPEAKPEPKSEARPTPKSDVRPEPKSEAKPEPKSEAKPEPKSETKPEPRSESKAGAVHLQVGAFASEKAATDQLDRLRKVGVKGYTERVKTQQGDRVRVRVGPFSNREAAEKVRAKLRGAGIDVNLVSH